MPDSPTTPKASSKPLAPLGTPERVRQRRSSPPRARHYWTNAPVTEIADADVEQTSLVKVLEKAGNGAVPARHGQKLYTIVTTCARGAIKGIPERPTTADYDDVKARTRTGNWVRPSKSSDLIRLLEPREMAVALNLYPTAPNSASCDTA